MFIEVITVGDNRIIFNTRNVICFEFDNDEWEFTLIDDNSFNISNEEFEKCVKNRLCTYEGLESRSHFVKSKDTKNEESNVLNEISDKKIIAEIHNINTEEVSSKKSISYENENKDKYKDWRVS